MSWTLLLGVVFALGIALFAAFSRRVELGRMALRLREREEIERSGGGDAQLHHPVIDLSRCLGCGACVQACPEDGVLDLVHGQAAVVNGARCMGISACERSCPVDAIKITIKNLETRRDVPVLGPGFEVEDSPGLFLAGEVTAHALVKTAIDHGTAVAAEVARRAAASPAPTGILDLLVVGAGPGGLACSLEARRHGLHFITIDQADELGGTVAKYPRRKLVLSEPITLPLYGRLKGTTFTKEQLIEFWHAITAEHRLPISTGITFETVERDPAGHYLVHTSGRTYAARHVCLAIGRRGTPRKLGVSGEDLPKVAYSLLDAHSYQGRRIVVVGGGDSAVEAALALAEQPGNEVTLSYRRGTLFRIRARNAERLERGREQGRVRVVLDSEVTAIEPDRVQLRIGEGTRWLDNDEVFVLAGGTSPTALLERCGVSFDASRRTAPAPIAKRGTGFTVAAAAGLAFALAALGWLLWNYDYYGLPIPLRPTHDKHAALRPGQSLGLALGIAAVVFIAVNLLYLLRRRPSGRWRFGSLRAWMTCHVATGILALLCAMLHAGMAPRDTPGGHAFWGLAVLLVTGAIGRYFYAYVPRAANGRELELAETKAQLAELTESWTGAPRELRRHVHTQITELVERRQWRGTMLGRILALLGLQRDLHRAVASVAAEGRRLGVPDDRIADTVRMTRQAWRTALMAAHYEDLRSLLASWRYLHRWVAALMVLLVIAHVFVALAYGADVSFGGTS